MAFLEPVEPPSDKSSSKEAKLSIGSIGKSFAAKHPSDVIGNCGPIQTRIFIIVTLAYLVGRLNNSSSICVIWLFRFFVGLSAYGRFLACYVLLSEWAGPSFRAHIIALYKYGWLAGALALPFLFQAMPDFRILQSGVSSFEIIILVPLC